MPMTELICFCLFRMERLLEVNWPDVMQSKALLELALIYAKALFVRMSSTNNKTYKEYFIKFHQRILEIQIRSDISTEIIDNIFYYDFEFTVSHKVNFVVERL